MRWEWMWPLVGVACGPLMAAVTARAAVGQPLFPPRWWHPEPGAGALASSATACGLLALLTYRFIGSEVLPVMCWFAITGLQLAQVDLVCRRLPHVFVGAMFVGGLVLLALTNPVQSAAGPLLRGLAVAVVLYVGVRAAAARGAVGGGDANLLAAVGLYLGHAGWEQLLQGLLIITALAACASSTLVVLGRISARESIAVGPAIVGGALITLVTP